MSRARPSTKALLPIGRSIWVWLVPAALLLLLFVGPIAIQFVFAFSSGSGTTPEGPASFEQFISYLGRPYLRNILLTTLLVSLVVTIIDVLIAVPAAYYVSRSSSRWRGFLLAAVVSPLFASVVVRTYGWQAILDRGGVVEAIATALGLEYVPITHTYFAVAVGLTHVMLPYAFLSILAACYSLDRRTEQAASDLGATSLQRWLTVNLPLLTPGIVTGAGLVFVISFMDYATAAVLGGAEAPVLATEIYRQVLYLLNWPLAAAIAVTSLGISLLVLYGLSRITIGRPRGAS